MNKRLLCLSLCLPLNLAWGMEMAPPEPPYPPAMPGWYGAPPPMPASEAGTLVREGVDALLQFLNQDPRPSDLKLAAFLEEKIAPYFDFERMADMVAGPQIQRLTKEQRTDLVQTIEQDFLRVLSTRLSAYDHQQIRYFRPHQRRDGLAMVTVGILNPNTYPSRLDFRLYRAAGGWKVFDVEANGNSAIHHYRQRLQAGMPRAPYPAQP